MSHIDITVCYRYNACDYTCTKCSVIIFLATVLIISNVFSRLAKIIAVNIINIAIMVVVNPIIGDFSFICPKIAFSVFMVRKIYSSVNNSDYCFVCIGK